MQVHRHRGKRSREHRERTDIDKHGEKVGVTYDPEAVSVDEIMAAVKRAGMTAIKVKSG
jgi:peptide methionine sulfoxide reductase MsrA